MKPRSIDIVFGLALITTHSAAALVHDSEQYVLVGDIGNEIDSSSGCGSVSYEFEIARFELTNIQYTEFLNSVARLEDPYQLYQSISEQHHNGGIVRQDSEGAFKYTVKAGYEDFPATYVSWFDAARYINWLHFGKPGLGSSILGTTEGTSDIGAYDTSAFSSDRHVAGNDKRRNDGAVYWIPSCDEWVKAGFYSPIHPNKYYKFATKSDTVPQSGNPEFLKNGANYFDDRYAAPFPYLTQVGAYSLSASHYGTFDQAGNVMEWVEDGDDGFKMALGGSYFMYDFSLDRKYWDTEIPQEKLGTFGLRVAKMPGVSPRPYLKNNGNSANSSLHEENVEVISDQFLKEQYVLIGNADNAADSALDPSDPVLGLGHVHYSYEIGKFAITNSEYAVFLNSVATKFDRFELYHSEMGNGPLGGITRRQEEDGYHYSAREGFERKPVTFISWFRAARLANFYHFGKPNTGESTVGTTEGTGKVGAYDTRNFPEPGESHDIDYRGLPEARNRGARYWIPDNNEWYKAVYYDPSKSGVRYWAYPTQSDAAPNNLSPPGDDNSANYKTNILTRGVSGYLTDVDAYPYSHSYYGVSGAGGQVWEWLEDWKSRGEGSCWRCNEWTKGLRGGSYGYSFRGLNGDNVDPGNPAHSYGVYGVRLARGVDGLAWKPVPWLESRIERVRSFVGRSITNEIIYPHTLFGSGLALLLVFGVWAVVMIRKLWNSED